ncbi:MAG: hypothetical protein Edafosvirus40_8 [Edafosvirus sp.]|uniref:Uncharacterized protein n=1 Tax=Edafosvirus sp. TaxID=2487765 RepID=A0A3G4ZZ58_9VIRU|nr:MAG: hypothetical protein Edafosvirus40_8 [Edafosvirus sp.]
MNNKKKYVFANPPPNEEDEMTYKPSTKMSFFYQVCLFRNPWDNFYYVRRFTLNGNNDFVDVKEAKYNEKQYKKLLEKCKINEYKCYSSYNFENIDYPQKGDILASTSNILSKDFDYSGYAPF